MVVIVVRLIALPCRLDLKLQTMICFVPCFIVWFLAIMVLFPKAK